MTAATIDQRTIHRSLLFRNVLSSPATTTTTDSNTKGNANVNVNASTNASTTAYTVISLPFLATATATGGEGQRDGGRGAVHISHCRNTRRGPLGSSKDVPSRLQLSTELWHSAGRGDCVSALVASW